MSDGVLYVVKFNKVRREHARKSIQRIQEVGQRSVVSCCDIDFEGARLLFLLLYYLPTAILDLLSGRGVRSGNGGGRDRQKLTRLKTGRVGFKPEPLFRSLGDLANDQVWWSRVRINRRTASACSGATMTTIAIHM